MASLQARSAFTYDDAALKTLLQYLPPVIVKRADPTQQAPKQEGRRAKIRYDYDLKLAADADFEFSEGPISPATGPSSSANFASSQAQAVTSGSNIDFKPFETPRGNVQFSDFIAQEMKGIDIMFRYDKVFEVAHRLQSLVAGIDKIERAYDPSGVGGYTISPPKLKGSSSNEHTPLPSKLGCTIVRNFIKQCPMYTKTMAKYEDASILRDTCLGMDGWQPTSIDKKGHGTYYKTEEGKPFHSFKCTGIVKTSVVPLASILLELDMYKEWYPMANLSEELGTSMTFHKQSRFAVMVPWPFSNREVSLDGFGVDDFDANNRIVIVARGLEDGEFLPDGTPCPPVKKGNARAGMSMSGFVLEILGPTETLVTFMMNVDPRIPHLPASLLNYISGKMMGVLLFEMGKAAKKSQEPKSPYQKRRKERKEVYDYLERRVGEAFGSDPELRA